MFRLDKSRRKGSALNSRSGSLSTAIKGMTRPMLSRLEEGAENHRAQQKRALHPFLRGKDIPELSYQLHVSISSQPRRSPSRSMLINNVTL